MKNYFNDEDVLLFNVKEDIYEWHDLSEKMPKMRDELLAKMTGYLKRVQAVDARMSEEDIQVMQNADELAAENAEGWKDLSRADYSTEYPVSSFPEGENNLQPYAHGVKPE